MVARNTGKTWQKNQSQKRQKNLTTCCLYLEFAKSGSIPAAHAFSNHKAEIKTVV